MEIVVVEVKPEEDIYFLASTTAIYDLNRIKKLVQLFYDQ